MLVQTLVQFFNVGEHNLIRLEDADWNDGLDMAHNRGESVTFTALYGGNMELLAGLLEKAQTKTGVKDVTVFDELRLLLGGGEPVDFDNVEAKQRRLAAYFDATGDGIAGGAAVVAISDVVKDLRAKAAWIRAKINAQEWVEKNGHGWYNGYYDNQGRRVESAAEPAVRMTLTGQVFPVMAGMASEERTGKVVSAVNKYLFDSSIGGVRLNTDFGGLQPDLGRAFSFSFGEKENGAVFSHMAVMYANALYQRGAAAEGFRVLNSLYAMAANTDKSRILPGLPEYFNNEGRGRYCYLTGSASWYVLTLLTQAFGVRGDGGDLVLAPKLLPEQFENGQASVTLQFANTRLTVTYRNPKALPYEKQRVAAVTKNGAALPFTRRGEREVSLARETVVSAGPADLVVEIDEAGR
jgi:cellobiose phosphorylase